MSGPAPATYFGCTTQYVNRRRFANAVVYILCRSLLGKNRTFCSTDKLTGLSISPGDLPDLEADFLHTVQTHLFPVSISEATGRGKEQPASSLWMPYVLALMQERCDDLEWWFQAHEARIAKLALFYRGLGFLDCDRRSPRQLWKKLDGKSTCFAFSLRHVGTNHNQLKDIRLCIW